MVFDMSLRFGELVWWSIPSVVCVVAAVLFCAALLAARARYGQVLPLPIPSSNTRVSITVMTGVFGFVLCCSVSASRAVVKHNLQVGQDRNLEPCDLLLR